jgi:hypothetical protein
MHVYCRGEEVELELDGSGSEMAWYLAKGSAESHPVHPLKHLGFPFCLLENDFPEVSLFAC